MTLEHAVPELKELELFFQFQSTVLAQYITLDQPGHLNPQIVVHLPCFCVYNNEISGFIVIIKYLLYGMFLLVVPPSGKRQFQLISCF